MIHLNSYRSYPVISGVDIDSNLIYDPTKDKARLGSDNSGIYISTGNGNAQIERFRLINNGNVGIGTNNPLYKLQVNGDINFTGVLYQNGNLFSSGGSMTGATGPAGPIGPIGPIGATGAIGASVDLSSYSQKSQNLADLTNVATARINIGLNGKLTTTSGYLAIAQGFNGTADKEMTLIVSTTAQENYLVAYNGLGNIRANALVTNTLTPVSGYSVSCTESLVCIDNSQINGSGALGARLTLNATGTGGQQYMIYSTGISNEGGVGLFQIYNQTTEKPILNIDANRYTTIYNDLTIQPEYLMNSAINLYSDDATHLQIQTSGGNLFFNNMSAPVTGTTDQFWRLNISRNGFLTAAKDITALGDLKCNGFVVNSTTVNHGNKILKNSNVIRTIYTLSAAGVQNTGVSSSLPPAELASLLPFLRWNNISLSWTTRLSVGFMYNGESLLNLLFLYASTASPSNLTIDNVIVTLAIYSKSGSYFCSTNVNILNSNLMAPFIDPINIGIDLVSNALVKGQQYVAIVFDRYVNAVFNGITYPNPTQIDLRNVEMFLTY